MGERIEFTWHSKRCLLSKRLQQVDNISTNLGKVQTFPSKFWFTPFRCQKWPQRKFNTSKDTIFCHSFYALSHGGIHFVWSLLALKTLKWKFLIGF